MAAPTRTVTIERHVCDDEGNRDVIHYAQYEGLRVVHTDWLGDTRLGTVRVNRTRCTDNPNCMCQYAPHVGHLVYGKPLVILLDDSLNPRSGEWEDGLKAYPSGTLAVVDGGKLDEWGECSEHAWVSMHRGEHDWAECSACGQITEAANV